MVEGRNYLSKLTAIENAIIQLGDGDFQKFCDTFLSQKQYGKIHGLVFHPLINSTFDRQCINND